MIDEVESKEITFNKLSEIENVRKLTVYEKEKNGFSAKIDVWEVDTEILFEEKCFSLIFHLSFDRQFPFDFPYIYLSQATYERIKYIPHVDSKRLVCTFDTEITSTIPNEPLGIVIECLKRAKSIIHDGLTGLNNNDFEDEFKAYWEEKYNPEKYQPKNILSLINTLNDNSCIKLIYVKRDIINYNYILHASDYLSIRFKQYLDDCKLEYYETDVFLLKNCIFEKPPFILKNRDVYNLIKETEIEKLKDFEAFINKKENPKLVLCKKQIRKKEFLFGWIHDPLKTNINGFRPGKLKPFNSFSLIQSVDFVERISTDIFTRERLENRTSGIDKIEKEKCFVIAGLGSIGSNLLYFLNSMNAPEFRLIDKDFLRLENINRHFLGFEYIGFKKTKALRNYILKNNPLQKVSSREDSIINVIEDDINYINEADYIFISIGESNIENWICQSLIEGNLTKPIFLFWVEPYLCGGHCLYLHPSNPEFKKYFEDDLFKFNVIAKEEYKSGNSQLAKREVGCQTTFIPYSAGNVISFISALFPVISSIIDFNKTKSTSFTWYGNVDIITNLNIKTTQYYRGTTSGTIIEHSI